MEYKGPFPTAPSDEQSPQLEWEITFPDAVFTIRTGENMGSCAACSGWSGINNCKRCGGTRVLPVPPSEDRMLAEYVLRKAEEGSPDTFEAAIRLAKQVIANCDGEDASGENYV